MNTALPEQVVEITDILNRRGFEAFAVGGCVRDMVSGKIPDDYDITTNALPEEVKEVFADFKTIDTGIKHGTVTVVVNGFFAEVTTYRIDGDYKDNRRPETVTFSLRLEEDLSRRDFTINALAYNPKNGLVDIFGGVKDIEDKIIRCVGNPKERFNEDALRILRAIRFASVLGYNVEKNTAEAVHENAYLLENISKERIFAETKKLLCGKNVVFVLEEYRDIAEIIFPGLAYISDENYSLSAKMVSLAEGAELKLAAILYFAAADDAALMLRRLKSDKATVSRVTETLSCRLPCIPDSESNALKCLYLAGEKVVLDYLVLKALYYEALGKDEKAKQILSWLDTIKKTADSGKCFKLSQLKVNGSDLINEKIACGSDIGKMLKNLLLEVVEGRLCNNRDELLKYAKNLKI